MACILGTMNNDDTATQKSESTTPRRKLPLKRLAATLGIILGTAAIFVGGYYGYAYASSPASIREPLYEHYHFRLQIIADGKAVDFADDKFQEGYAKDNCNAALTEHPIHFHDKKDQFVHIHWEGMTGGQVLKYYGWNHIGGSGKSLGQRFDTFPKLKPVPIHGTVLPTVPDGAKYYVYSGDENGFTERNFNEFTAKDLEEFFGVTSNSPAHELNQTKRNSLMDLVSPKAHAHGSETEHAEEGPAMSTEELKQLNNLIGNVVVFAQKDKPTDGQVRERFNGLEPLAESSCGG